MMKHAGSPSASGHRSSTRAVEPSWTRGAGFLVAGHGPKIIDDELDVFLPQRNEARHPGTASNTAGVRNEPAQEAWIPVFRYIARRIQFRSESPSHSIDRVAL